MALSDKGLVIGPRVPRGLAPAVEGLAREILRHRPQDIYTFAARHFEQLIELRETGRASVNISKIFDRASPNGKCRVLMDWIGPDNKCQPVSDGGSNHERYRFSVRKVHDSIEETRRAIKETTGTLCTISTKLLTTKRRRRRAAGGEAVAANRNGWSINETAKVFKKHAYENNENKEKSRNTQKSKKSIEKEIHSYLEKRSPRLSKRIAHCRFHRSWSVEDMHLAKNSSRRFQGQNQVEPPERNRGSIELSATSRLENDARITRDKSSHSVEKTENTTIRCLKRQKSAGQVEDVCSSSLYASWRMNRERVEYNNAAPRRTHSLVNVTSNGSYERASSGKKEETENISNVIVQSGVQGRREPFRGNGIEGKERKKSDEEGTTSDTGVDNTRTRTREIVVGKLNARLENDGTGSKDNGRVGETFEYQFSSDSKGTDIVDNTNVIIDEPRFLLREDRSDRGSKQEDSLDNQESVVLPSVIKKQGSNSRYSENLSERSKNDTNYLILPPISADASKPIKREDNLVLPCLSKLSEVIGIDRQPLKSSGEDRVASIEDGTEHMDELDASVSESQTLQQVSDSDYRSTEAVHRTARSCETTADATRYETAQGICTSMVVDRAIENDEGSEVRVEMYALEENCSNVTSDFVQVPQTSPPPTPPPVKPLDRFNDGNQKEKNKEQENEKEDEIENGNSSTMIGDEQQEREERRNMGEQKTYPVGNDELKSKLIEIETVERNIENTLISSETVLIAEDDHEPMASRPMDCSTNSESESESESEKSTILFGNNLEATSIAGEMLQEKDMLCDRKEDSSCNCFSKNDQTDAGPREEWNASTTVVVSSSVEDDDAITGVDVDVVDDGDKSEPARHGSAGRHEVSINFSKDVDPSCYVLTEGSPCEIPESVTTVIIPDKSLGLQHACDDEIFRFDSGTIDDTPRTRETIEQDTNPFGEYIVHSAETFQYSTDNLHVDFLRDIEDAVDRPLAYKDLGNIKEEEEEDEEEEEEEEEGEEEDKKEKKCKSKGDAMRAEKVVETRCTVDEATSDQLERNDTARVENDPSDSDSTDCTSQGQGGATLEDSKREQPLFSVSDTVIEPCVPELDLDSFRDATLSSVEDGNDSINVENLSGKENVDGDVICESERTTVASFDAMSPKRKATINKNPSSDSRPNPDHFQDENATSSHDSSIDRRDSSNVEEEIARELIENLTGETWTLEETTDKNTAEATDSFGRNDNIPSGHATVSTAAVEPIDIDMVMDTDMDMDGNTRDESEVKGEGDSVASTCSRSTGTLKNQNLSKLSKESVIDSNLRNESLEAAVGIIQFRRRRNFKKSDKEQNDRQDNSDTSVVRKATLSLPRENIQLASTHMKSKQSDAISNDGCRDEEKFRESEAFEAFEASMLKTKNGEWLSTALENEQAPGKQGSSISHWSRHTGEFHDSLPLPLLLSVPVPVLVPVTEISKGRISPMNATVHALERIRDDDDDAVKPLLTLKPDTSSFHYESPETETETETCVLLAFDLPKSLQLIENASNWSTSCVNLPPYTVRIGHDFDADKANVDRLAGECFDSDADDIREPLALDRTSNTILIEEILADDEEEKERLPASRSD